MSTDPQPRAGPRAPTFVDALLPIVVLIALLGLTIVLFGVSSVLGLRAGADRDQRRDRWLNL